MLFTYIFFFCESKSQIPFNVVNILWIFVNGTFSSEIIVHIKSNFLAFLRLANNDGQIIHFVMYYKSELKAIGKRTAMFMG